MDYNDNDVWKFMFHMVVWQHS